MAAVGSQKGPRYTAARNGSIKPGLRGARNWATAQVRAASYTKRGFWRLTLSLVTLAFFLVFGALWLGGFLPDARELGKETSRNSLISMGFVVGQIDVVGEGRLREQDVRVALNVEPGDYLFEMDVKSAQSRVEDLSWVDRAIVRRLWPNRVVVQIIERRPFALWQNQGQIKLVDNQGAVIEDAKAVEYAGLPLVVGENAADHMQGIQNMLTAYPILAARVDTMVQLPNGRWDIWVNEGTMRVKLPSQNIKGALRRLSDLQVSTRILDREIAMIDLRLTDRLSILPRQAKPA